MPRTRQLDVAQPSPVSHPLQPFTFPRDHHLVITTPGGIYSWDSLGLQQIFKSSRKGILAAKEARDGSQLLAVADRHNVVLHDCKRERDESWGLSGDEGQVRLLEYAPDAKSLFLSTSLTGAVQCYSIHESRLLDPAQTHPTPPTVLAVSSSSHLMLSASDNPPVVYLQNLTLKTPALQLHPSASSAAVVAASFHPQRPNVFLLAFNDGTLAAYDATQMARRNGLRMDVNATIETNGHAGEISHLSKLHRVTNRGAIEPDKLLDAAVIGGYDEGTKTTAVGSKSVGITGAAFLPGHRTRAMSVGGDGRCRIVDFEGGGKILRTWHVQAPVTSLSVLTVEEKRVASMEGIGAPGRRKRGGTVIGGLTSTNNIIAVGRADGKVCLFDSVGLKLDTMTVDEEGERIINVDWIKGPSPKAMSNILKGETAEESEAYRPRTIRLTVATEKPQEYADISIGLPSAMKGPILRSLAKTSATLAEPAMSGPLPTDDWKTVRHNPAAANSTQLHGGLPSTGAKYLDLFSPVKQSASPLKKSPRRAADSNPGVLLRPRLSSQTFSPESSTHQPEKVDKYHHLANHPLGVPIADMKELVTKTPSKLLQKSSLKDQEVLFASKIAENRLKRDFGRKPPSSSESITRTPRLNSATKRNGQVLAELRRLGGKGGRTKASRRKTSNMALFAPYMNRTGISDLPRTGPVQPNNSPSNRAVQEQSPSKREVIKTRQKKEDLWDSDSHSSDRDIWLSATTLSEDNTNRQHLDHRRQRRHKHRNLAFVRSPDKPRTAHKNVQQQTPPFSTHAQELDVRPGATSASFKIVEPVRSTKIVLERSPTALEEPLETVLTRYTTAQVSQPAPAEAPEPEESVRESVALGRIHSPKVTRPWIAHKMLSATSDEGMITAKEYITPVDAMPPSQPVKTTHQKDKNMPTSRAIQNEQAAAPREKLSAVHHNAASGRRKAPITMAAERQNAATAAAFALLHSVKPPATKATLPSNATAGGNSAAATSQRGTGWACVFKPPTAATAAAADLGPSQQQQQQQPQRGLLLHHRKGDLARPARVHADGTTTTHPLTRTQKAQLKERERKRLVKMTGGGGGGDVDGATVTIYEDEDEDEDTDGLDRELLNEDRHGNRILGKSNVDGKEERTKDGKCKSCPALEKQVRDLNDEVARLRAEVLGLKQRVRFGAR